MKTPAFLAAALFLSQAAAQADGPSWITAITNRLLNSETLALGPGQDPVSGNLPFLVRSIFKTDLCWSDGGGVVPGETFFRLTPCGSDLTRQTFLWDSTTKQIKSATKEGLCVFAEEGALASGVYHTLRACSLAPAFQVNLAEFAFQVLMESAVPMCLNDGGVWSTPWEVPTTVSECPLAESMGVGALGSIFLPQPLDLPIIPALFDRQVPFSLCAMTEQGPSDLCLGDGSSDPADTMPGVELTMLEKASEPYAGATTFIFDKKTGQIQSAVKPTLCVHDGGSYTQGETHWVLGDCADGGEHTLFVFNELIGVLQPQNRLSNLLQYSADPATGKRVITSADLIECDGQDVVLFLAEAKTPVPMPTPQPMPLGAVPCDLTRRLRRD